MKTLWRSLLCAMVLFTGAISCVQPVPEEPGDNKDDVSVQVGENPVVNMNSVTFEMNLKGITEYSYVYYSKSVAPANPPSPLMMFAPTTGSKIVKCEDGEQSFTVDGLEPVTEYVFYLAFRAGADLWQEVLGFNFTTSEISDDFALLGVTYEGYKLRMKLPDEVRERGNVIRYNFSDLVVYNENRLFRGDLDVDMLSFNSQRWFGELGSTDALHNQDVLIFEMNHENCYERDANGDMVYDDEGSPEMVANLVVPGEPTVFIAGEFSHNAENPSSFGPWQDAVFDYEKYRGETGEDDDEIDGNFGVGGIPVAGDKGFDKEDPCWTGYHIRKFFDSKKPEVLDAELKISIEDIGAIDATIVIEPDNDIMQFCIYVVDQDTYSTQLLPLLDRKPELMQWFTTSYYAYGVGSRAFARPDDGKWEPVRLKLSAGYNASPSTRYNVHVVGVSDETLAYQTYKTASFSTVAKSHPKPEVVVTAIANPNGPDPYKDPFEVWYNVKCTTRNAVSGRYACNDTDTWVKAVNGQGYSNSSLIQSAQGYFTAADIEKMNSPEGLNMNVATMEGSTMRLGVLVYNDENTMNDVDLRTGNTSIADATTGYLPDGNKIDHKYFGGLDGEWTLIATGGKMEYINNVETWVEKEIKSKIIITSGFEYPSVTPAEVYSAYPDKTKAEVDALYASFKSTVDVYNARIRGRNRLIMLGFNDAFDAKRTQNMTPYDCFIDDKYNAFDNNTILKDYGPKWYLEVSKNDAGKVEVTAPFNSVTLPTMSNCCAYPMYLSAMNHPRAKDPTTNRFKVSYYQVGAGNADLNFPVTVSEDMNTITIHALTMPGEVTESGEPILFYPNVYYNNLGQNSIMYPVYMTELELKRGWTEPEAGAASSVSQNSVNTTLGGIVPKQAPSYTRDITVFGQIKEYRNEEYMIPDPATFRERIHKAVLRKKAQK